MESSNQTLSFNSNVVLNNYKQPIIPVHPFGNYNERFYFEIAVACLIVVLNGLILIPLIATRRLFWPSYFNCLFSTIIASILFAMIGMPILSFLGQKDDVILTNIVGCKLWHIISNVFWDCYLTSLILMNVDLIVSLIKPDVYIEQSYQDFIKICLVSLWGLSLIINMIIVNNSSLKIDFESPVQPCEHVAKIEHLIVSLIWGLLLLAISFPVVIILRGDDFYFPRRINNKICCWSVILLTLNIMVVFLRCCPEVYNLSVGLNQGVFINSFDLKIIVEELKFWSWVSLILLPCFWAFDPVLKQAYMSQRRFQQYERIQSNTIG